MPSAKSSIVVLACLLLALLGPTSALALDFTLKGKIQSELDANPFLKEQQIKLQVLKEENGYVTIEMTEGNGEVQQAINQGIDVLGAELQNRWLFEGGGENERKTVNTLKKSIEYIKKMEGVKEIQLTAAVNSQLRKAAEQGHPWAFEILGKMYENGEGGRFKDKQQADIYYAKAFEKYKHLAEEGNEFAKCRLGYMYSEGKGVLPDYGEAIRWLGQCQKEWVDNKLAWFYATCKEPKYRNGRGAVRYALAAEKKQPNKWIVQDTLAAAYARDNQFTKAVAAQQKAIALLQEDKMDKEEKPKTLKQLNERLALYQSNRPYTDLGQQTENEIKPPAPKEPANQESKPPTSKAPEPARQELGSQAGEQPQPGSGPAQTTVERIKAFARNITHPREEPPKVQAAAPPAPKTQEPAQQEQGSQPAEKQQQEDCELTARMQEVQRKAEQKRLQEKLEDKKKQEERELAKKIEEQKQFAERREALRKEDAREKTAELARLDQVRAGANARATAAEAARLQSGATSTTGGRESAKTIAESNYEKTVVQRVRTNWKKPEGASWDASLQAQVFITVNRNGEVVDIRFSQKSRDNRFDELAEKTIRTAAPMPPFPAVMQKETTVIGLRFKAGEFGVQ